MSTYIFKLLRMFIIIIRNDSRFDALFCSSAHDVAMSKQHKSISASDVLKALEMMEFTDMVEQLQGELQGSYGFDPFISAHLSPSSYLVYRQLVKTGEKKSEKKKASHPTTGAPSSSSRKTMAPPPRPSESEGAPLLPEGEHVPVHDVPMDVDDRAADEDRHIEEQDIREDEEVAVDDEISEDDPVVESDEGESDELEDKVALEEEELRKDGQGLEEPPTAMVLHED